MTAASLKECLKRTVTPATNAEPCMKRSTRKKPSASSKSTLRVLNDLYLVEEDDLVLEGESEAVVRAIDEGRLHIPEAYKAYYEKVPYTGTVIASGDKLKYNIPVGARVMYGKFSCQRFKHDGKRLLIVRERDVHAILD